jgi:hypothetical protein
MKTIPATCCILSPVFRPAVWQYYVYGDNAITSTLAALFSCYQCDFPGTNPLPDCQIWKEEVRSNGNNGTTMLRCLRAGTRCSSQTRGHGLRNRIRWEVVVFRQRMVWFRRRSRNHELWTRSVRDKSVFKVGCASEGIQYPWHAISAYPLLREARRSSCEGPH